MYRKIEDFTRQWQYESEQTLRILRTLTDASLAQAVVPGGRTLGRLAWHITQTIPEMMGKAGIPAVGPGEEEPVPARAAEIAAAYESAAAALADAVRRTWRDDMLTEEREMYGERWPNGVTLDVLIRHQAHHRGQMTVLMRQAGLQVPGVYGPAREDWAQWGMAAPE